jgi:hypothetical protein
LEPFVLVSVEVLGWEDLAAGEVDEDAEEVSHGEAVGGVVDGFEHVLLEVRVADEEGGRDFGEFDEEIDVEGGGLGEDLRDEEGEELLLFGVVFGYPLFISPLGFVVEDDSLEVFEDGVDLLFAEGFGGVEVEG